MELTFNTVKETCIYTNNLPAAKTFYQQKLGLPLIHEQKGRHLFFQVGDTLFLCFNPERTKAGNSLPPHYGKGHLHFAFEVSEDQYSQWKQRFKDQGIPIEKEVDWEGKKSFYFRDPANNLGEIIMEGLWGLKGNQSKD